MPIRKINLVLMPLAVSASLTAFACAPAEPAADPAAAAPAATDAAAAPAAAEPAPAADTSNAPVHESGKRKGKKRRVTEQANKVVVSDKIAFATGSAEILSSSYDLLDELAETLNDELKQVQQLRIEGYTDNTGDRATNVELSKQRAEGVREALISRGVDAKRLTAEGYGPDKPIASNDTEAGREQNRRVEFEVVKSGGHR